jgi:hypothetical protein
MPCNNNITFTYNLRNMAGNCLTTHTHHPRLVTYYNCMSEHLNTNRNTSTPLFFTYTRTCHNKFHIYFMSTRNDCVEDIINVWRDVKACSVVAVLVQRVPSIFRAEECPEGGGNKGLPNSDNVNKIAWHSVLVHWYIHLQSLPVNLRYGG